MNNPFLEIEQKLDSIIDRIDQLESNKKKPTKILLSDFCKERMITRPTAYAWKDRGLIAFEKIGGRNFVPVESIKIAEKYQRP